MSDRSTPSPPPEPGSAPGARGGGAPDGGQADDPLRGSRTSGVWIATAGVGLLLVLLVIFVVQNTQEVDVAFLAWEGRLPLSAGILIAAAAGILITTTAGGLRILQLRRRVRRGKKAVKKADKAARKAEESEKGDRAAKGDRAEKGQPPARG